MDKKVNLFLCRIRTEIFRFFAEKHLQFLCNGVKIPFVCYSVQMRGEIE